MPCVQVENKALPSLDIILTDETGNYLEEA